MKDKCKSCARNQATNEGAGLVCEFDCAGVEKTDGEGTVLSCEDYEHRAHSIICMELNHFANLCGYFHNAYLTDGITLNNGYNCRHPKQEEREEIDGKHIGACYSWSCPLGYPPDAEDLVNYNIISEESAAADYPRGGSDPDYIVITDAETISRLRQQGELGLAVWPYKSEEKSGAEENQNQPQRSHGKDQLRHPHETERRQMAFLAGTLWKLATGQDLDDNEIQSLDNIASELGYSQLEEREFRW